MTRTAKTDRASEKSTESDSSEVVSFAVQSEGDIDFPVYWVKYDPADTDKRELIAALDDVLVDPVFQAGTTLSLDELSLLFRRFSERGYRWLAQKQFLPGVTDNLAHTIEEALRLKGIRGNIKVASGSAHLFASDASASRFAAANQYAADIHIPKDRQFTSDEAIVASAEYVLYHPLVERFVINDLEYDKPEKAKLSFPDVTVSRPRPPETIDLSALDDEELVKLSKDRLFALTLEEMKAIRKHFASKKVQKNRKQRGLSEKPTDVELEVLAQTWSEHCKHKIFSSTISYTERKSEGGEREESIKIDSLYKTFIKGATQALKSKRKDLLSVFEDNSGVVRWNDEWAVCFKVETHNSPSALEPYGGALTGILGVNRDILGTGLGARPIFNTDVFCFAHPESTKLVDRPKMLPPAAIPSGVRRGVQDGGNKSGIPTVNGAIYFHDNYRAKPLVFCGTGGLLPVEQKGKKMYEKHTKVGDRIIMVGGRVGKDGIHGATFSSESLNEGSPVTAVQIGDPFTQKRVIDFVLAARDQGLITGITDNGAGGLSSSVGEMANFTGGASMELSAVPLKYPGLEDWQVVVSESQERMTISTDNVKALMELAESYSVEASDIGEFHDKGYFEVLRDGAPVALLDLKFLHDGVPKLNLKAEWYPRREGTTNGADLDGQNAIRTSADRQLSKPNALPNVSTTNRNRWLLSLLSHPNIASREFVIRQYDHEVQGRSVVKPLMGSEQSAPCDAAVLKPVYDKPEGLVVSNGICPQWSEHDPFLMAVSAVDEAVRNAVCVGVDPDTLCLLDNFCWPDPVKSDRNPDGDYKLGQLVRTCQGLYAACLTYAAPLISGKDSMKNDFDDGVVRLSIPPTLLVSAIGKLPDCLKATTMQFKQEGDHIFLLSAGDLSLRGSHFEDVVTKVDMKIPTIDLPAAADLYRKLFGAIQKDLVSSAHDLSEGGLAVALSECCIGSGLGADVKLTALLESLKLDAVDAASAQMSMISALALFGEGPGQLLVTVPSDKVSTWKALWKSKTISCHEIGTVAGDSRLHISAFEGEKHMELIDVPISDLKHSWKKALPFD